LLLHPQLHDGLKKLNVRPRVLLLPEDYDEITNSRPVVPMPFPKVLSTGCCT
jgi:hypothetical protein